NRRRDLRRMAAGRLGERPGATRQLDHRADPSQSAGPDPGDPPSPPAGTLSVDGPSDRLGKLCTGPTAARCGVENRFEMLTYSRVRCAFEPIFALHRIHRGACAELP